jgi:hypothetical protein
MKNRSHSVLTLFIFSVAWGALVTLLLSAMPASAQFIGFNPSVNINQPTVYRHQVCNLPSTTAYTEFLMTGGAYLGDVCMVTPHAGFQQNGIASSSRVFMNGLHGKAVGAYFSAEGFGNATTTPGGYGGEVIGVYARVEPQGNHWTTALHGECRNRATGPGLCMGLNIELRDHTIAETGRQSQQTFLGINVQPGDDQRGVIGMQFQNPQAYRHSMDFAGTFIKLGDVDGVGFCMKFGGKTGREQLVEFWRGCGDPGATRHGYVNMNWNAPDTQLNR